VFAIEKQLGFGGVFKTLPGNLSAVCWEGNAAKMKESVRNAQLLRH
jgi:hypothetical protein